MWISVVNLTVHTQLGEVEGRAIGGDGVGDEGLFLQIITLNVVLFAGPRIFNIKTNI